MMNIVYLVTITAYFTTTYGSQNTIYFIVQLRDYTFWFIMYFRYLGKSTFCADGKDLKLTYIIIM